MKIKSRATSLTARVILFVGAATIACFIMLGVVVQSSIQQHFAEQDAGELAVVADSVRNILQQSGGNSPEFLRAALDGAVMGHHGVFFLVTNQRGQTVYESSGADLATATTVVSPAEHIDPSTLGTWTVGEKTYRGAVLKVSTDTQDFTVVTASDMDFHLHFLESFQLTLWSIMAGAAALTLLAAWYGVHQGHSPLRKLSDEMRDIQSDNLHVRLDPDTTPVELLDLVHSFNHMLGRLEEGFIKLSNFSADIAHELRTPLMNLITQTQVGLGKARQQQEYQELLYSNLEEQEKLAKMVGDMLWLAQTDHGLIKPVFAALDLSAEVNVLFEYFGPWADESNVKLVLEGDCQPVQGDRDMLRRAVSNLLVNAIRHTPADGQVLVRLSTRADGFTYLEVQNSGSYIKPEHLTHVFDRFYRVDQSRQRQSEGGGLGLAIVKSIIEVHEGMVTVSSDSKGTIFTLALPTQQSPGS